MLTLQTLPPRLPAILLALLVACCAPGNCIAQNSADVQSPSEPSFQLKVKSNLVLLRVVARDAKGNPIRGLKKEDFRVFDQGKEQTISQFDEEDGDSPIPASAASSTPAAPAAAAEGSSPRLIALYFDVLNSSDADLIQARDAADQYLAGSLQPNDRVAIFTAEKLLSDFTRDPGQIHQALSQLRAVKRGPANEHPCPDLSEFQANEILNTNDLNDEAWRVAIAEANACPVKMLATVPSDTSGKQSTVSVEPIRMLAQRIVEQAQTLTRANLQQFEQVVKYVAQMPGERSIVLVSPGFLSENEQFAVDRIIDRALRAQIVINSLDPKGLAAVMRESDASRNTIVLADPRTSQARNHLDASQRFVGSDVLAEVAEGTGGEFFHSDNDLKAGFGALAGDPPHYILAFTPQKVKWDGKFHKLKVTFASKEKGSTILARRGYFALESAREPAPTEASRDEKPSGQTVAAKAEAAPSTSAEQQVAANHAGEAPATPLSGSASTAKTEAAAKPVEIPGPTGRAGNTVKPLHLRRGLNRISAEQLSQFMMSTAGKSDAELAKQIANFQLTDRLDSASLSRFEASLPGDRSRQALLADADFAAFLKPPPSSAQLSAPPSQDEQIQMLRSATDFATMTIRRMPNFFATREVTRFADTPARQVMGRFYSYEPLHAVDRLDATVLYRDGKQVLDAQEEKRTSAESTISELVTNGEFGPILATVLTDASRTTVAWSRWEPGAAGPMAVFRFAVPRDKSHYEVQYCCVTRASAVSTYKQISAYHGEISIDPASGAILRIVIQADLKDSYPLVRADLLVEYGPVEIGDKAYICPLRSVAILKAYTEAPNADSQLPQLAGSPSAPGSSRDLPVQTMINDIGFSQYHLFRSETRIIPTTE